VISVRVRAAAAADVEAMGRVFVDSFRAAHRGQLPEHLLLSRTYASSAAGWRRAIAAEPDEFVCVAEVAGEVVGVGMGGPAAPWSHDEEARAAHPTGECFALYVAPGSQHAGAGRAMLSYLATRLAAEGMHRLVIGVLTVNAPARAFYERVGGRVLGPRTYDDDGVELSETVYVWERPPNGRGQAAGCV